MVTTTQTPKETPILFQTWKVRLIRKMVDPSAFMQTRRTMKIDVENYDLLIDPEIADKMTPNIWRFNTLPPIVLPSITIKSNYGAAGDLLWVKETHAVQPDGSLIYRSDWQESDGPVKWISSLLMRKEYARTWLKIESIRPQRLFDMQEKDATPEGWDGSMSHSHALIPNALTSNAGLRWYYALWDHLNSQGERNIPASTNPWLWKITFSRVMR